MSHQPPYGTPQDPYGHGFPQPGPTAPPGHPAGPGFPPPVRVGKVRPSGWWFLAPVGAWVLAGVVVAVGLVVVATALVDLMDAQFAPDGEPHRIVLSDTSQRVIMAEDTLSPECTVTDVPSGQVLPLVQPEVSGLFGLETDDRVGQFAFNPVSTEITIACTGATGTDMWVVGAVPDMESMSRNVLVTFAVASALGVVGLVWFVWLLVLMASRRPRT